MYVLFKGVSVSGVLYFWKIKSIETIVGYKYKYKLIFEEYLEKIGIL